MALNNELLGYTSGERGGDLKHYEAGTTNKTADPGHPQGALVANSRKDRDRIRGCAARQAKGSVSTCQGLPPAGCYPVNNMTLSQRCFLVVTTL